MLWLWLCTGLGIFTYTEHKEEYLMARIQILTLPSKTVGEYTDYPFAIVVDQVERNEISDGQGGVFAVPSSDLIDKEAIVAATGATGVIVADGTLDVA